MRTIDSVTTNSRRTSNAGEVPRFPGVIGTFMARDALSLAVSYLGLTPNDSVLLPLYTCQDVLKTFARTNKVELYDVRPDLTIDPSEIQKILISSKIRMMIMTNYFGFLQPCREELKKMCAEGGVYLIEDCAHSLLTAGSGDTGDMSIYSFRKILPLPDGGGLQINMKRDLPRPMFRPRFYSDALSLLISLKSRLNIHSNALSRSAVAGQTMKISVPAHYEAGRRRVLPLSQFACHQMNSISFPEVVRKRRADFEYWRSLSAESKSIRPLFNELPTEVCPVGFPVTVADRQSLEMRARSKGVHLRVHWRLDSAVGRECQVSHRLAAQMLTLPVYPELSDEDRTVLTEIVISA